MNDEMNFSALLARLDKACQKMNAGLAAFAIVLAVVVVFMSAVRASQAAIDLSAAAGTPTAMTAGNHPAPASWTYY